MRILKKISLLFVIKFLFIFPGAFYAWSGENETLNKKEEQILLKMARDTLPLYLDKRAVPSLKDYPLTPNLQKTCGVFVTLKEKATGNLRGCIGYVVGRKSLSEAVIDCTVQAATRDRRFAPLKKGADRTVYIDVSVLSPPKEINRIDKIKVGKHGLIISKGLKSGVLLPQVPVEWGWNRDAFLKAICKKAGLPDRAWEHGATLYVFTAQVFGENGPN
jgi:AmmeMemoRadiSam system protein A